MKTKRDLLLFFFICISYTGYSQEPAFIKSIYFGGGNYIIDQGQASKLHQFLDSTPNINSYYITIHSHTDNIGGASYNDWLSKMRSDAALQQLLKKNISRDMVKIKDFGQFNPVYNNSTLTGRMKNRRVDIIFWPLIL